ncbi:putative cytochrome P450, partial [Mollisia scopiformis]
DQRYAEFRNHDISSHASRSVLDLALEDHVGERKDKTEKNIDPRFKKWLIIQLRLFFFVGHDSTSPTICYCYYMLSKNDAALEKIRQEHDIGRGTVFGTELSQVSRALVEQPQLLNQLPYTIAVIKETLRLFPPASGFRAGNPGVYLEGDSGKRYPTADTRVWVLHSGLHRNPKYWKAPNTFLPERWLVGPEDPLYPMKGAWRAFEHGPRNCLGQAMAMLDLKITLVMTVRLFDFRDAYKEWDKLHPTTRVNKFRGERAYQVGSGGAHPADAFPCFVSLHR